MWEIKNIVSKGDYNYALVPDHPNSTDKNYVLEHRVIMENEIGRILDTFEIVHHVNGDKKDNRIENLQVMSRAEHARMHGLERGRKWVTLRCPECGNVFDKPHNKTFLAKGGNATFCSRSCSGKFYYSDRSTHEMEKAISENVVTEYVRYVDI